MSTIEQVEVRKYQSYLEYRDSLSWQGVTPKHWVLKRLKYITPLITNKAIEQTNPVGLENISSWTGRFIYTESDFQGDGVQFHTGDILFGKLRPYLAKVWLADDNGQAVGDFHVLRPKNASGKFLQYHMLTKEFINVADGSTYGAKMPRVSWDFLAEQLVAVPPVEEQRTIAAFLDYETARIDRLIAQQQRLIELLKEKRQAVISHAVTKGLNPDATMKDSGVEWLGDVPEHWRVCRLKHVKSSRANSFVDGPFGSNLKSEHFVENGDVYVIESNFATTGELAPLDLKTVTNEHFKTIQRSSTVGGDIIIAKIGARFGSSAILPELDKAAVVSGNSLKLTVNQSIIDVEYANHVFQHLKREGAVDDGANVTAQPALSLGALNNLYFVVPPLQEQRTILLKVKDETKIYDGLLDKTGQFIKLIQERRTALISAAVTGKIDLRGWVAPTKEAAA